MADKILAAIPLHNAGEISHTRRTYPFQLDLPFASGDWAFAIGGWAFAIGGWRFEPSPPSVWRVSSALIWAAFRCSNCSGASGVNAGDLIMPKRTLNLSMLARVCASRSASNAGACPPADRGEGVAVVFFIVSSIVTQTDRFVVSFLRKQESINISLEWIPACAGMTKCDMSLLNTRLWQCPIERSVSLT